MNVTPITPITVVKVLKNVPLNSSYADTLTFRSVSAQTTFFMGKAKYTFNDLTPIRLQNKIRLPVTADDIFDCNYIMFQNANFKNKWFYAFIKNVDFINVNECSVDIELDVMQSWMFDININSCYVEREHSNTDEPFENMQAEPINFDTWVCNANAHKYFANLYIAVGVTELVDGVSGGTHVVSNVYQGLITFYYPIDSAALVTSLIDSYAKASKLDSIVAIYMTPFGNSSESELWAPGVSKIPSTLDGYTPRNKKLYSTQFVHNEVLSTSGGKQSIYQNLWNESPTMQFTVIKSIAMMPSAMLVPINYNNIDFDYSSSLNLSDSPMCSWSGNTFANWLGQYASTAVLSNVMGALTSIVAGNPLPAMSTVANTAGTVMSHAVGSHYTAKSTATINTANYSALRIGFEIYQYCWNAEGLKMADDFLDVYGYATNQVKVPNITGRPYWNYVKTQNSKVTGSCGFDDLEKINSIFNNGITFWHGDYVGNYSLNNH